MKAKAAERQRPPASSATARTRGGSAPAAGCAPGGRVLAKAEGSGGDKAAASAASPVAVRAAGGG